MTNDIEGKVNEMGHTGECQEGCQCVLARMKSKSSPNTKPLNEKEVEKVLSDYDQTLIASSQRTFKGYAHAICSHFSKPVIKYPEKYELFEDDRNVDMSLGEAKMGMNKLIDEMKRLNGEGV